MGLWAKLFPPPNQAKFAQIMTKTLRDAGETRSIVFDANDFSLHIGDFTLFLNNAYRDYLQVPRRIRKEVLSHYSRLPTVTDQVDPDFSTARPNIFPKIRERYYHESLKLIMQQKGQESADFPTRLFSDDLTVEIAYDHPESVQIVHQDLLVQWGIDFDEALAIGRENLWERSKEDFLRPEPGLYCSPWRDTYDASRLFLHDLIWQLKVRGDHVAMVPHRDFLLVTGSDDVAGLSRMAELADELLQQNRSMSGIAVRLVENRWVPFLPPKDSPAYGPLKQALLRSVGQQYAEQTNLLETQHEKTGQDIFVASFNAVQPKSGALSSFAVWVEGVTDALLPRADYVNFGGQNGQGKHVSLGFADWGQVERVAGDLLEKTDFYPTRYRIRRFPTREQLREMELHEIER